MPKNLKNLPLIGSQHIDSGNGVTIISVVLNKDAVVDTGALHGISAVEKDIDFVGSGPIPPEAGIVSVIWVGVRAGSDGADGYFSAVVSQIHIDATTGRGWRPATHFTDMIDAIRGAVRIGGLSTMQVDRLQAVLQTNDSNMWERRSIQLREIWPD